MVEHAGRVSVGLVQWQFQPLATFSDFAARVGALLDRTGDAQIVLFPELFTANLLTTLHGWQSLTPADFGLVARYTDEYRELFQTESQRRGQVILAGSHLVGDSIGNLNTAHLFTPDGNVRSHVKTHIFPAEAASNTGEGDSLSVFDLGFVTIGVAVCYEAEIPEISTVLARRGAELILCPSWTVTPAGFWRVRHCAQARCIENQVFYAHSSTVGGVGAPIPDGYGKSSILGPCDVAFPAGGLLAETVANEEDVVTATIDLDLLHENRRSGAAPIFTDRVRRAGFYRRYLDELLPGADRLDARPGA